MGVSGMATDCYKIEVLRLEYSSVLIMLFFDSQHQSKVKNVKNVETFWKVICYIAYIYIRSDLTLRKGIVCVS